MKAESITAAGALEALHGSGLVRGWAFDPNHPQTPARVHFFLDGWPLGVAEANLSREGFPELGLGHGNVGFAFKLPPLTLEHMRIGSFLKLCLDAGGQWDLKNSPMRIDEKIFEILQQGMQQARLARLRGTLDGFVPAQGVYGWAWDPEYPDNTVTVYLFDEQGFLGEVPADQFRQDVKEAGFGSGQYGFSSTLENTPSLTRLHGGSSIRACFDREGRVELGNSPIIITPDMSETWIRRILQRQKPEVPVGTHVLINAAIIPTRYASDEIRKAYRPAEFIAGVYTEDNLLDPRASLTREYGFMEYAPSSLLESPVAFLDCTCIFGGLLHVHFGHFLTESLSRCSHFFKFGDAPIVFTHMDPSLRDPRDLPNFIRDLFDLLGIPLGRIHIIQDVTRIRKLIVPGVGIRHSDYVDKEHIIFLERQAKYHLLNSPVVDERKKVYLSRSKLQPPTVGPIIWAEQIFEIYLKRQGFDIVHPELLGIKEQLHIILSADYLLGFIGSAFHTLLLSNNKPKKVIYLLRNKTNKIANIYSDIDKAKGLDAVYLDYVEDTTKTASLVNFQGISEAMLEMGLVHKTLRDMKILYENYLLKCALFDILKRGLVKMTINDILVLAQHAKKLQKSSRVLPENPAFKHSFRLP